MNSDLVIRRATTGDAADIARLSGQLGYPVEAGVLTERLKRVLARNDQLVLMAQVGDRAGGWLQAQAAEIIESGFRVEIVGLIVDESMRRCGLGRRLVQEAETWAATVGARTVVVRTNIVRAESHIFYRSLGYRQTKTQHVYRKVLNEEQ